VYNFGDAISGLFYAFVVAVVATIVLVLYVIWQTFFGLTPWEICSNMDTDASKIQCMEAHYK
jgi:hypothetical protein